MLAIDIPGFGALKLQNLVIDYNGTLAQDGDLLPGVRHRLSSLRRRLDIHVVTADTFGKARASLKGLRCRLVVLERNGQDRAKAAYVRSLGLSGTVAIGNGRNDALMLRTAALGIALIQLEGAAAQTVMAADVVANSITDALDLLLEPMRLVATLRS